MGPVVSAAPSLCQALSAAGGSGEHLRAEAPVPVSQSWLKGQVGRVVYGEEATRDAVGKAFSQPAN